MSEDTDDSDDPDEHDQNYPVIEFIKWKELIQCHKSYIVLKAKKVEIVERS